MIALDRPRLFHAPPLLLLVSWGVAAVLFIAAVTLGAAFFHINLPSLSVPMHLAMRANNITQAQARSGSDNFAYSSSSFVRGGWVPTPAAADSTRLIFITFDGNGTSHLDTQEVGPTASFAPLKPDVVAAAAIDAARIKLTSPSVVTAGAVATGAVSADLSPGLPMALPESAHVDAATPAIQESAIEAAVFGLANSDRQQNGLPMLQFDPRLLEIARQRAEDQNDQPSLNHYLSDGSIAFVALFQADGIDFQMAGENLARDSRSSAQTAERVESALMASPTHRKNILEPRFQYLAVGSTLDSLGNTAFAQIFSESVALFPDPASVLA
ncbi:MAG TPA: CAP domain-containing protein [Chloroflexota bacterium]